LEHLDPHSADAEALRSFVEFAQSHIDDRNFEPQLIEHFKGMKFERLFNDLQSRVMELKLLPEAAEAEIRDALPQIEKQHINREIGRCTDAARLRQLTLRRSQLDLQVSDPSDMV
jgi:hypothetical protein